MYLLKKFQKLIRGIFIPQYGLQKLKVSRDLEKLVYKVVETPWINPSMILVILYKPFNKPCTGFGIIS